MNNEAIISHSQSLKELCRTRPDTLWVMKDRKDKQNYTFYQNEQSRIKFNLVYMLFTIDQYILIRLIH